MNLLIIGIMIAALAVLVGTTIYLIYKNKLSRNKLIVIGAGLAIILSGIPIILEFPAVGGTPPTIIINFAGNLSDMGGPYWRPPGETDILDEAGEGVWRDGYYTNDSYQSENWIYINLTVNDTDSGVDKVFLHWYNQSANSWLNTTKFTNTAGDYWEYNKTGVPQGKYSFDILANDTANNINLTYWNKTGMGGDYTRRFVSLNNTQTNISYTPLYLYNSETVPVGSLQKKDRFIKDQGPDDTVIDTGYLDTTLPTNTSQYLTCNTFVGGWFNVTSSIQNIYVTNIYVHSWIHVSTATENFRLGRTRKQNIGLQDTTDKMFIEKKNIATDSVSNNGYYYLIADNITRATSNVPDFNFSDNSIYELIFCIFNASSSPKMFSNRSMTTFILINIPDNTTLNSSYTDSDSDGLRDWNELYTTYTNPFLSDTDNDGETDNYEYTYGSDPNNYTSLTGTVIVVTNNATNIEGAAATLQGTLMDTSQYFDVGFEYGKTTAYGNTATSTVFTDGTEVGTSLSGTTPTWSYWYEVSADPLAPASWTGDTVKNMDFYIEGTRLSGTMDQKVYNVEIASYYSGTYHYSYYNKYSAVDTESWTSPQLVVDLDNATRGYHSDGTGHIRLTNNTFDSTYHGAVSSCYVRVLGCFSGSGTAELRMQGLFYDDADFSSVVSLNYLTTYHYRAFATNSTGTYYGADKSFTTLTNNYTAIRTYGTDYFVWLGDNTSAYNVSINITGFNEATEHLSILFDNGTWVKYYGNHNGINWTIHTFNVVRSYMDDAVGNITFGMTVNPNINYALPRTVSLKKVGNGFNFTGYTNSTTGTLSGVDAKLNLGSGYYLALWNESTFTWNYWIHGFGYNTDRYILLYDVITTKINVDQTWNI